MFNIDKKKLHKRKDTQQSPPGAKISEPLSESVYQSSDLVGTVAALSLDPCGTCTKKASGKVFNAKWFCQECQELMCEDCKSAHDAFKPTQNHDVLSLHPSCGPCHLKKLQVDSDYYCNDCEEFLCNNCRSYHSTLKILQDHKVINSVEKVTKGQGTRTVKRELQGPTNQRPLQQQRHAPASKGRVTFLKKFNAQATGDTRTPYISGSAFLPDSRLLLVDRYNCTLKLFDEKFRFVTKQQFKGWPQKVTVYDSSEVAVTVGLDVFRFSVDGDGLREKQKHSLGFYCYGLVYINKDMIAVTGEEKDEGIFCVYNLEGTQLSKLNLGKKHIPYDVTLDGGRSIAYICTGTNGKVTAIDIENNKILFTYVHKEVSDPCGITVDQGSTVYICGGDSCKIHEVSPDGKAIQVLMAKEDGLDYPRTMTFAPNWDTFIVGGGAIDRVDNYVQVYEM